VRIGELAQRALLHWKSLLSTLIINAASTVCYDGQYFFDTDHSEGSSGTQSNSISIDISALPAQVHGSTTFPSAEEASQCILQAIQAIIGFKDDQGEPMGDEARSFLVQAPPSLMAPVLAACSKETLEYGVKNLLINDAFKVQPAINPRLSSWTANFAVFRTDGQVKPFIRQEEEGVTISAIAENSEEEFKNDRHLYGVKALRNVGYGYWQHACLVTMT